MLSNWETVKESDNNFGLQRVMYDYQYIAFYLILTYCLEREKMLCIDVNSQLYINCTKNIQTMN